MGKLWIVHDTFRLFFSTRMDAHTVQYTISVRSGREATSGLSVFDREETNQEEITDNRIDSSIIELYVYKIAIVFRRASCTYVL